VLLLELLFGIVQLELLKFILELVGMILGLVYFLVLLVDQNQQYQDQDLKFIHLLRQGLLQYRRDLKV
jgi:hypothetical protein